MQHNECIKRYFQLFAAEDINAFANKSGSTVAVSVDIAFKALIRNIHLPKACQDLICAQIVVFGYEALQLFHKSLCFSRIGSPTLFHANGKLCHDLVHAGGEIVPLLR